MDEHSGRVVRTYVLGFEVMGTILRRVPVEIYCRGLRQISSANNSTNLETTLIAFIKEVDTQTRKKVSPFSMLNFWYKKT